MRGFRNKLAEMIHCLKGFDTGYTTNCDNKIIVDYEGKRYIVSFEEIKSPNENIFKDIDMYL